MFKTVLAEWLSFLSCFVSWCVFSVAVKQNMICGFCRRNLCLFSSHWLLGLTELSPARCQQWGPTSHKSKPTVNICIFFSSCELNISLHVHPRLLSSPSYCWQTHLPHWCSCLTPIDRDVRRAVGRAQRMPAHNMPSHLVCLTAAFSFTLPVPHFTASPTWCLSWTLCCVTGLLPLHPEHHPWLILGGAVQ